MSGSTAVVTGEGVAFDLPRAGVGSRTVATLVDFAVQFAAFFVLVLIDAAFAGSSDSAALSAVVIVEVVLVLAGYPIFCEWLSRGRTLGKLWLGLRVVRDDGGPIGFRHALVRGLSSLILEKPGLVPFPGVGAAAGLITAACSERDKRIGDMLAGTYVLNEGGGTTRQPIVQDFGVPYWLQPWAASLDLSRLDDRLALAVRQFVGRAGGMTPPAAHALGEQLRHAVFAVVTPPPPPGTPTFSALMSVLAERRRRATFGAAPPVVPWVPAPGAAHPPSTPPPPPPAGGPFAPPG